VRGILSISVAAVVTSTLLVAGCRSMCLTDFCRTQFPNPAANAPPTAPAITPEPETRTSDGLPIARSYEQLRQLFMEGNAALDESMAKVAEIDERQKALMNELEREAAWRSCDQPNRPRCGLIAATMETPDFVASFSASECKEPFGKSRTKLSKTCAQKFKDFFVNALAARYHLADAASVNRECGGTPDCRGLLPYELLCLKSHNDELLRRFNALNAPLQEERDRRALAHSELGRATVERNRNLTEAFERAQEQRAQRARDFEQLRAFQLEQDQREREEARKRQAIAAMILAGGASFTQAMQSQGAYTPANTAYLAARCTSDYECGSGRLCLKGVGEMAGVCATAVNQYGNQSFAPPAPGSWKPGQRQCWTMAECPVAFRCESGQCVK